MGLKRLFQGSFDLVFALASEVTEAIIVGDGNLVILIDDQRSSLNKPELFGAFRKRGFWKFPNDPDLEVTPDLSKRSVAV
jgi:hypothetical protein